MKQCPKCEQQCSEHRDVCPLCAVPLVREPARPDKAVFASTDWVGLLEAALRNATELEKAAARSGKAWHCYMVNATEYLRTALEAERGRCPTVSSSAATPGERSTDVR
jgi:hypothetical protein